jgi:hypothetical protein
MTTVGKQPQGGQDKSDRQLLEAFVRDGDGMAFELLIHRYQTPLYGFIRRQIGAPLGIAANICRYEARKQLARPQTPSGRLEDQPGWAPSPEANAHSNQVGARIAQALDGLQAHQREVFVLYQYTRLSYEEIAGVVGAPLGTVKSRMNGALTALRSLLVGLAEAQP